MERETTDGSGISGSAVAGAGVGADLVLVSCVKTKEDTARAARDLYSSQLFREERGYAERSGLPWYILSARWGLVGPEEEIAPYELELKSCSAAYRRAWGSFAVAQLAERQEVRGAVVEVHANTFYAEAVRGPLETLGARVRTPLAGLSFGRTLSWYKQRREAVGAALTGSAAPGDRAETEEPGAAGEATHASQADQADEAGETSTADAIAWLSDRERALAPKALRERRQQLSVSGLYSWWVDQDGAEHLSTGLGARIEPGIVYVGQAGATRQRSGRRSDNTLYGRLVGMHLGGRAEFSTFRLSLASVLVERLGVSRRDEEALSVWMERHLSVVPLEVANRDGLGAVEERVVAEMDPPLNLSRVAGTAARRRLSELRRAWKVS